MCLKIKFYKVELCLSVDPPLVLADELITSMIVTVPLSNARMVAEEPLTMLHKMF